MPGGESRPPGFSERGRRDEWVDARGRHHLSGGGDRPRPGGRGHSVHNFLHGIRDTFDDGLRRGRESRRSRSPPRGLRDGRRGRSLSPGAGGSSSGHHRSGLRYDDLHGKGGGL